MCATPCWLPYLQALATPLIGFFVAYVAWRQWRTAQEAQKERLFDRRYELFELLDDCRINIIGSNKISEPNRVKLRNVSRRFLFLFDKIVYDYVLEFYSKSEDLRSIQGLTGNYKEEALNREKGLRAWFDSQREELPSKFSPFLGFESSHRNASVFRKVPRSSR